MGPGPAHHGAGDARPRRGAGPGGPGGRARRAAGACTSRGEGRPAAAAAADRTRVPGAQGRTAGRAAGRAAGGSLGGRTRTMDATELRQLQTPLKARYKEEPEAALITLKAEGEIGQGNLSCKVDTGRALVEAGLHPATGGT